METKSNTTKRGSDIEVGDLLVFLGRTHRITACEPIPNSPLVLDGTLPADTFVAYAETYRGSDKRWGMTIDPTSRYEVL